MAEFGFHNKAMEQLFNTYIEQGYWQRSFIDHWDKNAESFPDKIALVDSRRSISWSQVKLLSERLAIALLELGLRRDDVISVQLPWSIESCLIRAAHEKAGIIELELAPTLRHQEMKYHLQNTEAKAVIIPWKYRNFDYYSMIEEIRPDLPYLEHIIIAGELPSENLISLDRMLEQPVEQKYPASYLRKTRHTPFELSYLRHTTGTTGLPKLVMTNAAGLEWGGRAHLWETGEKIDSDSVLGIICPAITGPNYFMFYSSALVAPKIVLLEHFRPESALELIEREHVNVIGVVPTQLAMMIQHPNFQKYNLNSLRFIICTGASLNYSLAFEAENKFGCPIVQHYGSMECGIVAVMQHYSEPQAQRLLTVGKPSKAVQIKLVDKQGKTVKRGEAGTIMAKSPCMGFGYYKDSAASAKTWTRDAWCNMGDLGQFDNNGNLVLVGREKEIIIRGGQNIFPLEVENLLLTNPKISQVAIVAMPDLVMGEKACAFIVLRKGEHFDFEEMVNYLKEKKIALYKIPERLELVDKMPLAGETKIDKKALQKNLVQSL